MVLMALSTTTAVAGFANNMFGAVNSFFGRNDMTSTTVTYDADMDMSDLRTSREFDESFKRILRATRITKKAAFKLDELVQIDANRAREIKLSAHFLSEVGLVIFNFYLRA